MDLTNLIASITNPEHKLIINGEAGREHYKLLAYISLKLKNAFILELGTHYGTSSVALSINPENRIRTYDVRDIYTAKKPNNVECVIGNIFELKQEHYLLQADFIFVDTRHLGDFEWLVYAYLRDHDYRGLVIFDDIHWSDDMISFWNKIPSGNKYDLTDIGHGHGKGPKGDISGTGLVDFSQKIKVIK